MLIDDYAILVHSFRCIRVRFLNMGQVYLHSKLFFLIKIIIFECIL